MKVYVVGGAVRDQLLGLPVHDRDYVVVGATPQQMLDAGYKPVGQDFPVFLHPHTHEEYALARTERKTAPGYSGFSFHSAPDVTLEDDLRRRDLTINAIAQSADGQLVDPYGGQADIKARLFRHVSDAFAEDPVRILRVARFAARFTDFEVAPATMSLMQSMVASGEVDALVPERVWQELSRGLMQAKPSRMFAVLERCGALSRIAPESARPDTEKQNGVSAELTNTWLLAVDEAAAGQANLSQRFALWAMSAGVDLASLCDRLKVPGDCRDLAQLTLQEGPAVARASELTADAQLAILSRCDAFRKPARFEQLLQVIRWRERASGKAFLPEHNSSADVPINNALNVLRRSYSAAKAVDAGALAQQINTDPSLHGAQRGEAIKAAVHAARLRAIVAGGAAVDSVLESKPKKKRFLRRLLSAPFAIVSALVIGFLEWLWQPLLNLMMRLGRWRVFRWIEGLIARLPPYAALVVFAVPGLLMLPFKFAALYLIAHGQKLLGMGVFMLAKVVGTALVARIFSLTAPALMRMNWFRVGYERFMAFKKKVYALVFDHPWIRLARRTARTWRERFRRWRKRSI